MDTIQKTILFFAHYTGTTPDFIKLHATTRCSSVNICLLNPLWQEPQLIFRSYTIFLAHFSKEIAY